MVHLQIFNPVLSGVPQGTVTARPIDVFLMILLVYPLIFV